MKKYYFLIFLFACFLPDSANASYYNHRLNLGFGIAQTTSPSQTSLSISGEYEYRWDPYFGTGFLGSYIFSTPGFGLVGIPFFFHPLEGDWFLGAAPLLGFSGSQPAQFGVRLETQLPIPLGVVTILPSVAIDFFANGQQDFILGLGIRI